MYYALMCWDNDLGWCHADFGGYDYHDVAREMKRRISSCPPAPPSKRWRHPNAPHNLKIVAKKRPGCLD